MKSIIFTRPDGGLSIMHPVEADKRSGESKAAFMKRVKRDIPADCTDIHEIELNDIPADRAFRSAWIGVNGAISHDMNRAREIQKNRMRAVRAPLLADLDLQYQRADETGDTERKRAIATEKQALRDVTKDPAIAVAKSVDELARVWPAVLSQSQ